MVDRVSALAGHEAARRFGADGDVSVTLTVVPNLVLHQIAAWPGTLATVGTIAAQHTSVSAAPAPRRAAVGSGGALLRIEPLKWWLFGAAAPALDAEQGATLDVSHSRTHVRIAGLKANTLLNRHLPLDLRDVNFPAGSVASTAFHHVGVTLWRSAEGFELFLPRGFALSLWELLLESAAQFGAEVTASN
jgi:heterotetrameric sarcosine oxidase gamma subunit